VVWARQERLRDRYGRLRDMAGNSTAARKNSERRRLDRAAEGPMDVLLLDRAMNGNSFEESIGKVTSH